MPPQKASDAERWQQVKDTFQAALERAPEARASFLQDACGSDTELRREVESLLTARAQGGGFLSGLAVFVDANPLLEGRRLGPYRVLETIGHGGMGVVHRAVRDDDVFHKTVALKLIGGSADPETLRRFSQERQILGRLQHPNIATILDGGTSEEGQPYLVMEYVEGETIDVHCRRLGTRERVALMRTVCAAVQYAHQNLVVHRDLKPQNILVTAEGQPKLLDFGIARILAAGENPESAPTASLLPVMTPEYASPEQVRGQPVTTSSDVYSLGVIFYELLTGRRPYEVKKESLEQIVRTICETEPLPPSLAARTGPTDGSGTARAGVDLRGDLDTIVLKALHKDPSHRYGSVAELSADLGRYLEGRPVSARKDTLAYRTTRFVRRNRVAVAAAAVLLVSLVGGLLATLWQAHGARRERDAAERARARSEALVDFMLGDLQEKLEPSNRLDVVADLATEVLKSVEAIPPAERTAADTAQRARVFLQLGSTRHLQGELGEAEARIRASIGLLEGLARQPSPAPRVIERLAGARTNLVRVLADKGDAAGALEAARGAVRELRQFVPAHPGDDELRAWLAFGLNEKGRLLFVAGNMPEAQADHVEAIRLLEALPEALRSRRDNVIQLYNAHLYVGRVLEDGGEFEESLSHFQTASVQATAYSAAHPSDIAARHQVSIFTNDMGRTLRKLGRLPEAAAAYEQALAITKEVVDRDPGNNFMRVDLSACHSFLGRVHELQGAFPAALAQYGTDVAIMSELHAKDPGNGSWRAFLAEAISNEARALLSLGRLAEAVARNERSLALRETLLAAGPEDPVAQADVADSLLELGRVRSRMGDNSAAHAQWTRAGDLLERALKVSDRSIHRIRYARVLLERGDTARARAGVERLIRERCREPELLELCKRRGIST